MDGNSNSNDNDNAHHDHSRSIANVPAAPDSTTHTIHAAAPLDDPNTATPTTSSAAPNSSPSSSFLVETYSSICTLYRTEHRSRLHWEAEAKQLQLAHKTERLRWEGVEVGLRGDVDRLERRVRRWEREDEARKRRVVEGAQAGISVLKKQLQTKDALIARLEAALSELSRREEPESEPKELRVTTTQRLEREGGAGRDQPGKDQRRPADCVERASTGEADRGSQGDAGVENKVAGRASRDRGSMQRGQEEDLSTAKEQKEVAVETSSKGGRNASSHLAHLREELMAEKMAALAELQDKFNAEKALAVTGLLRQFEDEKEEALLGLRERLDEKAAALSQLQERLDAEKAGRVTDIQDHIGTTQKLQEQNETLTKELIAEKAKTSSTAFDLKQSKSAIRDLQAKTEAVTALETKLNETESDISRLNEVLRQRDADVEKCESTIRSLQDNLEAQRRDIEAKEAKRKSLEEALSFARARNADDDEELQELRRKLRDSSEWKDERDDLVGRLQTVQDNLNEVHRERDDHAQTIKCLHEDLRAEKDQYQALQNELATEKDRYQALQDEFAAEKEQHQALQNEITALGKRLEHENSTIKSLRNDLQANHSQLQIAREKSAHVEKKIRAILGTQASSQKFQTTDPSRSLEAAETDDVESLLGKLQNERSCHSADHSTIDDLQNDKDKVTQRLRTIEEENDTRATTIQTLETKAGETEKRLKDQETQLTRAKQELEDALRKLKEAYLLLKNSYNTTCALVLLFDDATWVLQMWVNTFISLDSGGATAAEQNKKDPKRNQARQEEEEVRNKAIYCMLLRLRRMVDVFANSSLLVPDPVEPLPPNSIDDPPCTDTSGINHISQQAKTSPFPFMSTPLQLPITWLAPPRRENESAWVCSPAVAAIKRDIATADDEQIGSWVAWGPGAGESMKVSVKDEGQEVEVGSLDLSEARRGMKVESGRVVFGEKVALCQ